MSTYLIVALCVVALAVTASIGFSLNPNSSFETPRRATELALNSELEGALASGNLTQILAALSHSTAFVEHFWEQQPVKMVGTPLRGILSKQARPNAHPRARR